MDTFLVFLKAILFGPPKFLFDHRLYSKLVKEVKKGSDIEASEDEPEVIFSNGPIDGVLGYIDVKTGRITIDVLENFITALENGRPMTEEEIKQRFDDRITRTLAHEGGHWHLQKRHGKLVLIEKIAILGTWSGLGLVLAWAFLKVVFFAIGAIFAGTTPIFGFLVMLLSIILLIKLISVFLSFWNALSVSITYQICYGERYARKWGKKPDQDKRWDAVIRVD